MWRYVLTIFIELVIFIQVKVVQFLLSDDNSSQISWGTRRLTLKDGQSINYFPRLMRKKARKLLWNDYMYATRNDTNRVGRALFYHVSNALTDHDPRIFSAVDYVSTKLINENIEIIQEVMQKMMIKENNNQKSHKPV